MKMVITGKKVELDRVLRELERRRTLGRKPPNAIKQHDELED